MPPKQTLGRIVDCNNYQDAGTFLRGRSDTEPGQRGRQLAILREGVYAINPALFVVITEDSIQTLPSLLSKVEVQIVQKWRAELLGCDGFKPVLIGQPVETADRPHQEEMIKVDSIGIVTAHDGPSLAPGEIIAPPVAAC